MCFSFLQSNKTYQKIVMSIVPIRKAVGYHHLEVYRGCDIDLRMRITRKWIEVWNYDAIWGNDPDADVIGQGNGLATKELAVECAKKWIDDALGRQSKSAKRPPWVWKKTTDERNKRRR